MKYRKWKKVCILAISLSICLFSISVFADSYPVVNPGYYSYDSHSYTNFDAFNVGIDYIYTVNENGEYIDKVNTGQYNYGYWPISATGVNSYFICRTVNGSRYTGYVIKTDGIYYSENSSTPLQLISSGNVVFHVFRGYSIGNETSANTMKTSFDNSTTPVSMPNTPPNISLLEQLDSLLNSIINWVGLAINSIMQSPYLLLTVGFLVVGGSIGIFGRLLHRN